MVQTNDAAHAVSPEQKVNAKPSMNISIGVIVLVVMLCVLPNEPYHHPREENPTGESDYFFMCHIFVVLMVATWQLFPEEESLHGGGYDD